MVSFECRMMAPFKEDEVEPNDSDGSFVFVEWKEFCITDSEEEDLSPPENNNQVEGIESSDLEPDDESETFESEDETNHYRMTACRTEIFNVVELPPQKRKEDMEIKDVVKEHVLPFLPAKSLTRFKAVSKEWNNWISRPFLAHKQSYLFKKKSGFFCQRGINSPTFLTLDKDACGVPSPDLNFFPEAVVVISSCNGLLLCQSQVTENLFYLCNPVNKEWKAIPEPSYYHPPKSSSIILAFEPSELNIAADFELVCAFPVPDTRLIFFEIYSSERGSWTCPEIYLEFDYPVTLKGGFYINRMAYFETTHGKIIAFDMTNGISGILDLPRECPLDGLLTQLHGELCYVRVHTQVHNAYTIDIHGGMDMGLKQSISIILDQVDMGARSLRVLPSVKDDAVVFGVGGVVYCYHLMDKKVEVISRRGPFGWTYLPYVNSLVSVEF
ncbi:hypothetical protein NMG60_11026175 [Bertholletia excelsa]